MVRPLLCLLLPLSLGAAGHRTTPPILNSVAPLGIARGTTTELTVEGLNLAKTSAIYFNEPGIKGRILNIKELPDLPENRLGSNGTPSTIDLGPLPPRNRVTVEIDISPEAEVGPVLFRLQTPLGTTADGSFLVEPYYGETPDKEPNDNPENAVETVLPTILTGAITKPGDLDYFKIQVKAGDELVFEDAASLIGSTLQPVVAILGEDQAVLKEYSGDGRPLQFAHKFDKAGTYYVRVADFRDSGRSSNFYRIKVGRFPIVTAAWPLGLQLGKTRDVTLTGYDLASPKISLKGELTPDSEDTLEVRPNHSFNTIKLAVGPEPEIDSTGANLDPAKAQTVSVPVTINGRLKGENYFRFHAAKGAKLIVEVNARRLGSDLDSFIEVLDANAKPIERATVRPVSETAITLADRDSFTRGLRILSWSDWKPGDDIMVGREIIRVETMPNGPDEDVLFDSFEGQRIAYFDTSTEDHAIDQPVYKVRVYPPGKKFPPNGLPLVHLYYQNDDGGPGYGKDSLVHFTAPADGDYLVRIHDVRGLTGPSPYRLTIRQPRPDFRLDVSPRNPNVPLGGTVPVRVTAFRMDDFDGAIDVSLENLAPGLHATSGTIAPGQVSTTLLLSSDVSAKLEQAAALKVAGRAGNLTRWANPDDHLKLISLMPKPDVVMAAETKVVELEPGNKAQITVNVDRQNDFQGRVPVAVMNLPPRVKVIDVGLNGVLITEQESRRSFTIEALPSAEPIEQMIYVAGLVETRSNLPSAYAAPQAILLRIKPSSTPVSARR